MAALNSVMTMVSNAPTGSMIQDPTVTVQELQEIWKSLEDIAEASDTGQKQVIFFLQSVSSTALTLQRQVKRRIDNRSNSTVSPTSSSSKIRKFWKKAVSEITAGALSHYSTSELDRIRPGSSGYSRSKSMKLSRSFPLEAELQDKTRDADPDTSPEEMSPKIDSYDMSPPALLDEREPSYDESRETRVPGAPISRRGGGRASRAQSLRERPSDSSDSPKGDDTPSVTRSSSRRDPSFKQTNKPHEHQRERQQHRPQDPATVSHSRQAQPSPLASPKPASRELFKKYGRSRSFGRNVAAAVFSGDLADCLSPQSAATRSGKVFDAFGSPEDAMGSPAFSNFSGPMTSRQLAAAARASRQEGGCGAVGLDDIVASGRTPPLKALFGRARSLRNPNLRVSDWDEGEETPKVAAPAQRAFQKELARAKAEAQRNAPSPRRADQGGEGSPAVPSGGFKRSGGLRVPKSVSMGPGVVDSAIKQKRAGEIGSDSTSPFVSRASLSRDNPSRPRTPSSPFAARLTKSRSTSGREEHRKRVSDHERLQDIISNVHSHVAPRVSSPLSSSCMSPAAPSTPPPGSCPTAKQGPAAASGTRRGNSARSSFADDRFSEVPLSESVGTGGGARAFLQRSSTCGRSGRVSSMGCIPVLGRTGPGVLGDAEEDALNAGGQRGGGGGSGAADVAREGAGGGKSGGSSSPSLRTASPRAHKRVVQASPIPVPSSRSLSGPSASTPSRSPVPRTASASSTPSGSSKTSKTSTSSSSAAKKAQEDMLLELLKATPPIRWSVVSQGGEQSDNASTAAGGGKGGGGTALGRLFGRRLGTVPESPRGEEQSLAD